MKLRKNLFYSIIILAIFLRLFITFFSGGVIHSDEIFQSLERAHGIAFGYGSVPFEFFELNERPMLYPYMISFFMRLFYFFDFGTVIFLIRLFHSLLSVSIVVILYLIAKEIYDEKVAFLVAFLSAIWWELLFFAPRTLPTPLASNFLLISIYLLILANRKGSKIMFLSGIFFGLSFMIRFPILVFLLPISLYLILKNRKEAVFFVSAFLLMFVIQGVLDLFTWGSFLKSLISFINYDVIQGKSIQFGISPFYYYFIEIIKNWNIAAPLLLLIFFIEGTKKKDEHNFIIDMVLLPLILYSLVQHKEYRFIFSTIPFLLLLFAKGVINISKKHNFILYLLLIVFVSSSLIGILNVTLAPKKNLCSAEQWVGKQEDATGLIVLDTWSEACGYTYLHKNIPTAFFPAQDIPTLGDIQIRLINDLSYTLRENVTFNYVIFTYDQSNVIRMFENNTETNFTRTILNIMDELVNSKKFIKIYFFKEIIVFKRI